MSALCTISLDRVHLCKNRALDEDGGNDAQSLEAAAGAAAALLEIPLALLLLSLLLLDAATPPPTPPAMAVQARASESDEVAVGQPTSATYSTERL